MSTPLRQDRPSLGLMCMIGFCVFAPLGDAVSKHLTAAYPVLMLVAARYGVQALILLPLCLRRLIGARLSRRFWMLSTLRAALHLVSLWMMITALIYLPLADALAIAYVMPFLMLLLGHYVLGEVVGSRRIYACVVGFAGVMMVIQPAFAAVGWPALLPVGVAVGFSIFMLITRMISMTLDPIAFQALGGVQATLLVIVFIGITGQPEWPLPDTEGWVLILLAGLLGVAAHLFITWSLRLAPSATVAPIQYVEIPIATLIGWAAFGDLPNGLAAVGIAITVATGLYILWCERQTERAQ